MLGLFVRLMGLQREASAFGVRRTSFSKNPGKALRPVSKTLQASLELDLVSIPETAGRVLLLSDDRHLARREFEVEHIEVLRHALEIA